MRPPGPERRAKREASRRLHGPDPGELEPCPYCGRDVCLPTTCPADPDADGDIGDVPHAAASSAVMAARAAQRAEGGTR